MEQFESILETTIPLPTMTVNVTNPYPKVGESISMEVLSQWVTEHQYKVSDGLAITELVKPSILGHSSVEITTQTNEVLQQEITIANASGESTIIKRVYPYNPQETPYFRITVDNEVVRIGEEVSVTAIMENGYTGAHFTNIKVFKEKDEETPVFEESGNTDTFSLTLYERGIYDVEMELVDDLNGTSNNVRVGMLITVTPALAPRSEAIEIILPHAANSDSSEYTYDFSDTTKYPVGSTIVLKADPKLEVGYPKRLNLQNILGTLETPYIITFDESVQFEMPWYNYWGINMGNCTHVVIDGRGYQNVPLGLKFSIYPGSTQATAAISVNNLSSFVEAFHVEIDNTFFAGFFCKTDPDVNNPKTWRGNSAFEQLKLHHNYIHDTRGEGMYLGYFNNSMLTKTNSSGEVKSYQSQAHVGGRIYRNHFSRNGYDSIQYNNGFDIEIAYNILFDSGNRVEPDQTSGMSVSIAGRIHHNLIHGWHGPCWQGGPLGKLEVFNNIMVNGAVGSGGIYILSSETAPEQNTEPLKNQIPFLIHNNIIHSSSGAMIRSSNLVGFEGIQIIDNFGVTYTGVMFAGDDVTAAAAELNSYGNIILKMRDGTDFALLDSTYEYADSSNVDYRISSKSILTQLGNGSLFNRDFRGYKNWHKFTFPIGPYMGLFKDDTIQESLRVYTFTTPKSTVLDPVLPISITTKSDFTEYRMSEDSTFTGVPYITLAEPVNVLDTTFTIGTQIGHHKIYLQVRDAELNESLAVELNVNFKVACVQLALNSAAKPEGTYNEDTGVMSLRLSLSGVKVNIKNNVGKIVGKIVAGVTSNIYNGEGFITGDDSGLWGDDNILNKSLQQSITLPAGTTTYPISISITEFTPGIYNIYMLQNGNKGVPKISELGTISQYFIITANGISTPSSRMINNFDEEILIEGVVIGEDGMLNITGSWDSTVIDRALTENITGSYFGVLNTIKIISSADDPKMTVIPLESMIIVGESEITDSGALSVVYTPTRTSQTDVTWETSNSQVATVSTEGVVSVHDYGQCTITVRSVKNPTISATKVITCSITEIPVTNVYITSNISGTTPLGRIISVTSTILPTNANAGEVLEYTVSENLTITEYTSTGIQVRVDAIGDWTIQAESGNSVLSNTLTGKAILELMEDGLVYYLNSAEYQSGATTWTPRLGGVEAIVSGATKNEAGEVVFSDQATNTSHFSVVLSSLIDNTTEDWCVFFDGDTDIPIGMGNSTYYSPYIIGVQTRLTDYRYSAILVQYLSVSSGTFNTKLKGIGDNQYKTVVGTGGYNQRIILVKNSAAKTLSVYTKDLSNNMLTLLNIYSGSEPFKTGFFSEPDFKLLNYRESTYHASVGYRKSSVRKIKVFNRLLTTGEMHTLLGSIDNTVVETVTSSMVFDSVEPGYFGGNLTLQSNITGLYRLAWGVGNTQLTGYDYITGDLTISLTANVSKVITIPSNMVIPQGATTLLIIGKDTTSMTIPVGKILDYSTLGTKLYSTGILSDIHVKVDDAYYTIAVDLPAVYNYFTANNVGMVVSCGDNVDGGQAAEWAILNEFLVGKTKTYFVAGNHDNIDNHASNATFWWEQTGLPSHYTIEKGDPSNNTFDVEHTYGKLYTQEITSDNDIFVMLPVTDTDYTASAVKSFHRPWLENILIANPTKRIFLMFHIPLENTSGNVNGAYTGLLNPLDEGYDWLMPLLQANRNVIHFHGHTHFLAAQAMNDATLPYWDGNGLSGKSIHIPSTAYPRNEVGTKYPDRGEFVVMSVYANHIITEVISTTTNKKSPLGCTLVNTQI